MGDDHGANRRHLRLQACSRLTLLFLVLVTTVPAQGQKSPNQSLGPTDTKEFEAFLDRLVTEQMEKRHIPALVFVLVKDGRLFFAKGYGYADLESKRPVDPERTLFRVASVSKPVTATAVLQLIEQGKLDLEDDVNRHLSEFQLEKNFPRPVTIAHLLTHTGGFEDRYIAFAARGGSPPEPLGDYLARRMPPRVTPPGAFASYSNHGYALLGHVVERVAGVPFARYVEEKIFTPLAMTRSSFELPPAWASDLAVGYRYRGDRYQPWPLDYVRTAPASQLVSTATDMARFMIAHLQEGRLGKQQIFQPATAKLMHRQQFTHHPRLPGWCFGFAEQFENGLRAIRHGGDWGGFGSELFLLPEKNLGFFFSYTNGSQSEFEDGLVRAFLDQYFPESDKSRSATANPQATQQLRRFAGSYQSTRRTVRTIEKIVRHIRTVSIHHDGTLSVDSDRFLPVEPLLFESASRGFVAFREDPRGRATHLFSGTGAFVKLRWYETRPFHQRLLGFFFLVFLSACLVWPLGSLLRRWRKRSAKLQSQAGRARALGLLISGLNLAFLVGGALLLARYSWDLVYGVPPALTALLWIPVVSSVLTLGMVWCAALAWKDRYWSFPGRLYFSLVTLTAVGFTLFLHYWNLLGFRY